MVKFRATITPDFSRWSGRRASGLKSVLTTGNAIARIVKEELGAELRKFADTGELERSWTIRTHKGPHGPVVIAESSSPYSRQRDSGGQILPKRAKALALPWDEATKRLGPPKTSGLKLFRIGNVLYERISKKRKRPRYILRSRVYQHGNKYAQKALRRAGVRIERRWGADVMRSLRVGK